MFIKKKMKIALDEKESENSQENKNLRTRFVSSGIFIRVGRKYVCITILFYNFLIDPYAHYF